MTTDNEKDNKETPPLKEQDGLVIRPTEGEYQPPLQEAIEKEGVPPEKEAGPPGLRVAREGKIPLQPAVIRLFFRIPGEVLAWQTKWDGWKLSDEDLQDIVEVYEQLGIETAPWVQALVVPVAAYGNRFILYTGWKRKGKPEEGGPALGATPEKEPPGR